MSTKDTIASAVGIFAFSLLTLAVVMLTDHNETAADYLPTPIVQCE